MTRDESLEGIRPKITIELIGTKNSEEAFMHSTLRSALKFQHNILIGLIRSEKQFNPEILDGKQKNKAEKRAYITTFLQKNTKLKNTLIGIIIGVFSQSEFETYLTDRKNLDKRMIEMVITRFLSDFAE